MTSNNQLSLGILPQLSYRAQYFVSHSGVAPIIDSVRGFAKRPGFQLSFIVGAARTGKTHLAVKLCDELGQAGRFPRMISGIELDGLLAGELALHQWGNEDVLVIDDAHHYLLPLQPGSSGPFVNLVERFRKSGAQLVLFSGLTIGEFSFDDHVRSRINAGAQSVIGAPEEAELPQLIEQMARQRGFQLSERKTDFLERRIGRTVPAIEEYLEKVVHLAAVLGKKVDFSLLGDAL